MKRNAIAVLFFLVSLLATSCTKVFTNGDPITEERSLDHSFNTIAMYNNVNVKLVQSDRPRIELTCPENLIEKITNEIEGDTLYIRNENEYNWLRSHDYSIDMTVYYDHLRQVDFASVGDLTCIDPIQGVGELNIDTTWIIDTTAMPFDTIGVVDTLWTRSFYLRNNEGCGDIDLTLDCDVVKNLFSNGTSVVTLRGQSAYTEIIMQSYGTVHAEELNSNFVRVQSRSTNDAYVWARTKLTAWLYSIGNVYYKGDPWVVKECNSDGRVIKLE